MALIYRNVVLKIITCRSIGRLAKMNGMSCTSIAMMEWVNVNVIIDVLTGCTLIILHVYACRDIMILCLHYQISISYKVQRHFCTLIYIE